MTYVRFSTGEVVSQPTKCGCRSKFAQKVAKSSMRLSKSCQQILGQNISPDLKLIWQAAAAQINCNFQTCSSQDILPLWKHKNARWTAKCQLPTKAEASIRWNMNLSRPFELHPSKAYNPPVRALRLYRSIRLRNQTHNIISGTAGGRKFRKEKI